MALTTALFGAWAVSAWAGDPGPGAVMLAGHTVGAGAAVVSHRAALRRPGAPGAAALLGAPAVLLLLGFLFWWS